MTTPPPKPPTRPTAQSPSPAPETTGPDTLWVSLIRMPTPPDVDATAAASPAATRMLEQWRTCIAPSKADGAGDREDFWEMAARLDAALSAPITDLYLAVAGTPVRHLCFTTGEVTVETDDTITTTGQWVHVVDLSDDEAATARQQVADGTLAHYGPLARFSSLEAANLNPADNYPRSPWFNCHAGRDVLLSGFFPLSEEEGNRLPTAGEKRVEDCMAMFASYGYPEVLVKMVRAKHGLWRVPASADPTANRDVLAARLGWSLIGVEGSPDTMLVQQIVPMRFEYRVFVVDGRPVTGAGCIEEHTPLHADPATPFSPLVREHRNYILPGSDDEVERLARADDPTPTPALEAVESQPDIVARVVEYAAQVARDLTADGSPWGRAYVLDVALDEDDCPLLIEANGLTNAGLYASNPRLVVHALVGGL